MLGQRPPVVVDRSLAREDFLLTIRWFRGLSNSASCFTAPIGGFTAASGPVHRKWASWDAMDAALATAAPRERGPMESSFYDSVYRTPNYFRHHEFLYRPYIRALIAAAGLKTGSEVLDAGCGQGFFSHLLASEGMVVYGTDASVQGIRMAAQGGGRQAPRFFVSDLSQAATTHKFDCVFVRSCSLYNTDGDEGWLSATAQLLENLKASGLFIFVYNTNVSGECHTWRHHRLHRIRQCLELSCNVMDLFFINKIDALLLGRFAFSKAVTTINGWISERTGVGGEAVALCQKRG